MLLDGERLDEEEWLVKTNKGNQDAKTEKHEWQRLESCRINHLAPSRWKNSNFHAKVG